MSLLSLLGGAISGGAQAAPSPNATPDSSEPTVVTVHAPQPNYDNTKAVNSIDQVLQSYPEVGGGDNPGAWGKLPQSVQHGTLRNVLGALGDAFLMSGGYDPQYEPRIQRQEVANAMAGFQQNPGVAASRVAATATPGSADLAQNLYNQQQNMELRKQIQSQNNDYRQSMIQSRNDNIFARMGPIAGGMIQGINDPDKYKSAYGRLDQMVKRVDPTADPTSALGLPTPEDWDPSMTSTAGATGGQVLHNTTSNRSIDERAQAAQMSHQDRQVSNSIAASRANHANQHQPTTASIMQGLINKQNAGQKLTPSEQAYWDKYTKSGGQSTASASRGLLVSPTSQTSGSRYTPQQAMKLPKGTRFQGTDGNWYIR